VAEVQKLFASADDAFKKRDVPEYLLGNIDFEIMRDPVIAPSGITYERSSILEHLHRVGHFDPITRSKLSEKQLISNLALKSVLDDFLDKYGVQRFFFTNQLVTIGTAGLRIIDRKCSLPLHVTEGAKKRRINLARLVTVVVHGGDMFFCVWCGCNYK